MPEITVRTRDNHYLCPFHEDTEGDIRLRHETNMQVHESMRAYYICSSNSDHRLSHDLGTGEWISGETLRGL